MPITLRGLCSNGQFGLTVLAGHAALDRRLTWAHASELPDPTPFLDGGELLLTTGVSMSPDAGVVRDFVAKLVGADVAGVGFGVGLGHDAVPASLVEEAGALGLPVLQVPRRTTFISLAKEVARAQSLAGVSDIRDSYHSLRKLLYAAQQANGVRALVCRVADLIDGWCAMLDSGGHVVEISHRTARAEAAAAVAAARQRPDQATVSAFARTAYGEVVSQPVTTAAGRLIGHLVAGRHGTLGAVSHANVLAASSLLALMLARVHDAQRSMQHLRNIAMRQLADGQVGVVRRISTELWGGFPREPLQVMQVRGAPDQVDSALRTLSASLSRSMAYGTVGGALHIVVSATETNRILALLDGVDVAAGVSDECWWDILHRGVRQAAQAAAEAESRGVRATRFAALTDSGLSAYLDPARSKAFAAAHLEPLLTAKGGGNLYAALRTWLEHNGSIDPAAAQLGIHRHTLRSRLARAAAVLGVDLESPTARAELWLELRLLGADGQPE